MDMKNTVILLILLLAVLGLIVGVCYTQSDDSYTDCSDCEETVYEDSNGVIIINLEPQEKNESFLEKFIS